MIRGDDLLESDRYMSLPAAAQAFFIHLMCCADDFGLVLMSPLSIGRRCFKVRPGAAKLKSLVRLLESADLIRPYAFEGAPFAFIPRFRQRLQRFSTKCPMPPPELYADDEEARFNFIKYKDKFKKIAVIHREPAPIHGDPPPEVKGREVEVKGSEVEVKGSEVEVASAPAANAAPSGSADQNRVLKNDSVKRNGENHRPSIGALVRAKAMELKLKQGPEEPDAEYQVRVIREWDRHHDVH
jgi:hypothetical protein